MDVLRDKANKALIDMVIGCNERVEILEILMEANIVSSGNAVWAIHNLRKRTKTLEDEVDRLKKNQNNG